MGNKPEILRIRCYKDTIKDFKNFLVDHEMKDMEDGLKTLLLLAENHPHLVKRSRVRYV